MPLGSSQASRQPSPSYSTNGRGPERSRGLDIPLSCIHSLHAPQRSSSFSPPSPIPLPRCSIATAAQGHWVHRSLRLRRRVWASICMASISWLHLESASERLKGGLFQFCSITCLLLLSSFSLSRLLLTLTPTIHFIYSSLNDSAYGDALTMNSYS